MKAGAVLALLLAWLAPLSAIYQDQVGEWDWHQQNVGRPKGVLFEVRIYENKHGVYLIAWLLPCTAPFMQLYGGITALGTCGVCSDVTAGCAGKVHARVD